MSANTLFNNKIPKRFVLNILKASETEDSIAVARGRYPALWYRISRLPPVTLEMTEWAESTDASEVMSRERVVMLGMLDRSPMLIVLREVAKTW
jgi:hypothetical protein